MGEALVIRSKSFFARCWYIQVSHDNEGKQCDSVVVNSFCWDRRELVETVWSGPSTMKKPRYETQSLTQTLHNGTTVGML